MTKMQAVIQVAKFLRTGKILRLSANNGDAVTAGPHITAVGPPLYSAHRYGSSRFSGSLISSSSREVATWVVDNTGRRAGTIALRLFSLSSGANANA